MQPTNLALEAILENYAEYPLSQLENNESFYKDVCQTGVNEAQFLARRFSFMKPQLAFEVVGDNKELLRILLVEKLTGRKKYLYLIERNIINNLTNPNGLCLFVKSENERLYNLEEAIASSIGVPSFKLPERVRLLSFKELTSGKDRYKATLKIELNTLTTKVDLDVQLVLDYMFFEDVINQIDIHLNPTGEKSIKPQIHDLIFERTEVPLHLRFKQHIQKYPSR